MFKSFCEIFCMLYNTLVLFALKFYVQCSNEPTFLSIKPADTPTNEKEDKPKPDGKEDDNETDKKNGNQNNIEENDEKEKDNEDKQNEDNQNEEDADEEVDDGFVIIPIEDIELRIDKKLAENHKEIGQNLYKAYRAGVGATGKFTRGTSSIFSDDMVLDQQNIENLFTVIPQNFDKFKNKKPEEIGKMMYNIIFGEVLKEKMEGFENQKSSTVKNANEKDEDKKDEDKKDEDKKGEGENDEVKKNKGKKDEGKKDEGKKDEGKKDEGKKDEGKKDEDKKDEGKKDGDKKSENKVPGNPQHL